MTSRATPRWPIAQHGFIRRHDDGVIATTPAQQRRVARSVLAVGGRFDLIAFRLADTHLHHETPGDRRTAAAFAHDVESSLTQALRLPCGLFARLEAIESQQHGYRTFGYLFEHKADLAAHLASVR